MDENYSYYIRVTNNSILEAAYILRITMGRSLHIGTFAGIPVKIHWTFMFTIGLVAYMSIKQNLSLQESLILGAFVLILFVCVVLHEYGHALTARRFGIKTVDIILSPIGGLARLEKLPEKPAHEILVAIAGPAVNVVLAGVLIFSLTVVMKEPLLTNEVDVSLTNPANFMRSVIGLNVILFLFNLVPAFPMDGGRVLRALLSIKWGRNKGTQIATFVGRLIAMAFILYGIWSNQYTLALIGMFVFYTAGVENQQVKLKTVLDTLTAGDIMQTEWKKLHLSDDIQVMLDYYRRDIERSFVVYDTLGYVAGVIPEAFVGKLGKDTPSIAGSVDQMIADKITYVTPDTPLIDIFHSMNNVSTCVTLVRDGNTIVGKIDRAGIQHILDMK